MRAVILGAGSWGSALAILLGRNGVDCTLAGRDQEEIASMGSIRENLKYLPGFVFPEDVQPVWFDDGLEKALGELTNDDLIVIAVPSSAVRAVCALKPLAQAAQSVPVLIASKGMEAPTGLRLSQVAKEFFVDAQIGAMGGPNLALEIVRGAPTASVIAFPNEDTADRVRKALSRPTFRVYRSDDVAGIEMAGAAKNVMAVAAGISDGLGFGDNTKGALLARGLREMMLLSGVAGGKSETILGIAGVGDLFATAASPLSRNYRVGHLIAKGSSVEQALAEVGQVAEGASAAACLADLARREGLEIMLIDTVRQIVDGRMGPLEGVGRLMDRATPVERIPT